MSDYKSVCILGRQPALGLAELESLFGADNLRAVNGAAVLKLAAEDIPFARLGGTIKTARILAHIDGHSLDKAADYLKKNITAHLENLPEGKLTLGLSVYGLAATESAINKIGLELKRIVKRTGRACRVVPNKTPALSSAQVLHNKLTHTGGWELLLVADGDSVILAQTLFVQDIEAYAARDQARPKRDSRVGMLPPKLAQILLNLASTDLTIDKTPRPMRVLDPFCGTGVILQEALLMDYSVLGTDIEPRMVEYAQTNIGWLVEKYPRIEGQVDIEVADATNFVWPRFSSVVSETFLGRPLAHQPTPEQLRQIVADANTIIKKFLINLSKQLQPGQKAVLALPAWRLANRVVHLPTIANLTEMGYAYLDLKHVPRDQLIYFRDDQIVARQIIRIVKT